MTPTPLCQQGGIHKPAASASCTPLHPQGHKTQYSRKILQKSCKQASQKGKGRKTKFFVPFVRTMSRFFHPRCDAWKVRHPAAAFGDMQGLESISDMHAACLFDLLRGDAAQGWRTEEGKAG
jgi:hypothetical protein